MFLLGVKDNTTTPSVVQKSTIQTGKWKAISSSVDLDDLLSHRGLKKQKPSKTPLPKVPKFTPPTVDLDDPVVNMVLVQIIPPVQIDPPPPPAKAPHKTHPSEPSKHPPNLVLDEGYAWKTANAIEKETHIALLEGKISEFNSSLEKAREETIAAFKKSDEYKNRLDNHYTAGYEDFHADAKEAFPDLDFDSFKIPFATKSSLLPTSSEDVNVVDDATNEVT
ncbi:hypothetical protein SO802_017792 [Lithocarpus litseifolius]|uniref:Uncharacterized protein n=1 Tax=Lithocarpus litseifolius TaxID=425828 RepID=A0AAW2CLY5_9ROSI